MLEKIQRTLTSIFPVEDNRQGACNGCGDCCKLPFRCTFLKTDANGNNTCAIYRIRPLNCRKFPRTRGELEAVKENCGFYFSESTVGYALAEEHHNTAKINMQEIEKSK